MVVIYPVLLENSSGNESADGRTDGRTTNKWTDEGDAPKKAHLWVPKNVVLQYEHDYSNTLGDTGRKRI